MSPRDPAVPGSRRIHVLHVAASTEGAVAEQVADHVRDQVERGWTVALACPSYGDLGYAAREAGAQVHWWEAGALLARTSRLGEVVDQVEPDVVHLHGTRAGLVGRLVVRDRVPTVHQPHAWSLQGPHRAASVRWERYGARWTSALVVGSQAERRLGESLGISAPTTVLPPGVDLTRFRAAGGQDRVAARKELGLEDRPTVVCVGPLEADTGQQDLLVDWAHVRRRVPHAQLVLVGEGAERRDLERLGNVLPGVRLVGARTDVPTWLAAADVVVVPARSAGTEASVLHAMACARSVVATDVGGVPELLTEGGGAVIPLGDGPTMVDALAHRLLKPERADEEGWVGRAQVETRHDAASAARELARVYLRLVGARRGR
jgi:glycosyltransferase involved in cell wall biosynthesis